MGPGDGEEISRDDRIAGDHKGGQDGVENNFFALKGMKGKGIGPKTAGEELGRNDDGAYDKAVRHKSENGKGGKNSLVGMDSRIPGDEAGWNHGHFRKGHEAVGDAEKERRDNDNPHEQFKDEGDSGMDFNAHW
jgi:hypothetical protein